MHGSPRSAGFRSPSASNAVGVFFLISGATGLVVGRVLQRRDARLVMIVGALLGGGAIACIGLVQSRCAAVCGVCAVRRRLFVRFGVAGDHVDHALVRCGARGRWRCRLRPPGCRWAACDHAAVGVAVGAAGRSSARCRRSAAVFVDVIVPIAWFGVRSFPVGEHGGAPSPSRQGTPFAAAIRSRFFVVLTRGYLLAMGTQVGGHRAPVQPWRRDCHAAAGVVCRVADGDVVGAGAVHRRLPDRPGADQAVCARQSVGPTARVRRDRARARRRRNCGSARACSASRSATC